MSNTAADRLPKNWQPHEVEPALYKKWQEKGYFRADASSEKPPFSIVLPPPNVTGQLHIGHAFDHTLADAIVRRKRMQGYEVLWLPGMDHAGIATQTKVEAMLKEKEGKDRFEYGREEFVNKVWEWKRQYGGRIGEQMRALGDSVDWSRERFTMDEGLSRAVQTIFKALYDRGLIYRAHRLVNWSPKLRTAVSDIEVVYKEVPGELVSLRYGSLNDDEPHIVVATTRMETMLGDVAIAVHPEDDRYRDLIGTVFEHPFRDDVKLVVIADEYVDPEFGTGAVKITPAHDPNDYAVGLRHDLPMLTIMDESGNIAGTGTQFDGLTREEARIKVREALAEQGRIVEEIRPYMHSVGHSERSGEAVEPRLSLQWFVKVEELAKMAGDAVRDGSVSIHPASLEPRYFEWVDDMHDWCISRQLWWGHHIPIWYGPDGDIVCVGPDEVAPEGYTQDPDVLDTWFSSALWPFSTMGWPEATPDLEKFYPTSVLVTAYDILFFWVARMMMFGTFAATLDGLPAHLAPVPFKHVYLHGLVRDEKGRKMSKSLGNGIDPMDWVERYGTDALRFALARGANPGVDVPLGEDAGANARNFVTKLFNATKFALLNGAEVGDLPDPSVLSDADTWILDRLAEIITSVDVLLDDYQFAKANEELFHFIWDEFCDWYLEIAKIQISSGENAAAITRRVLGRVLDVVLKLMHPTMPFVTETLWTTLTGEETVTCAPWPTSESISNGCMTDLRARTRMNDAIRLVTEIRRFRSEQGVKPSQTIPVSIDFSAYDLESLEHIICALARVANEKIAGTASFELRLSQGTCVVRVDMSAAIDVEAERARLRKELAAAEKEIATTTAKLDNPAFCEKAPKTVVEKIRARARVAAADAQRITERLRDLNDAAQHNTGTRTEK